jgi:phosphonate transport system substrate-binding protein
MQRWGKRRLFAASLLLCLAPGFAAGAAQDSLEVGIFPLLSVRTLMERFQPMRDHLEKSLNRPVVFVTAPDFRSFVERTQAKQYPYVITAPHFGRLAQLKAGYRPMLQPVNPMQGVFFVRKDSKIKTLADLRGANLATPDALALVTALGESSLHQAGLVVQKDVRLTNLPTHNAAILSLQHGQTDAALASNYQFMQMKPEEQAELRIIGKTAELPAPMLYLAGPSLSDADAQAISNAIIDFAHNTESGRRFMESTRYEGMEKPSAAELKQLDAFIPPLERALQEKP